MSSAIRRRRGSVLIVAMVCLLVVTSLLGQMLLSALRSGRQLHAERDFVQCELLMQAGVDRGHEKLARAADYAGEILDLPASEILGSGPGRITIEIQRLTDAPLQLQVSAEYPVGNETSVRRSRTITLPNNR